MANGSNFGDSLLKDLRDCNLGFIGAGNMAKSIAFPLFEKGLLRPGAVMVSATKQSSLEPWCKFGCVTTTENRDILERCLVVVWAVKPQIFPIVLKDLTSGEKEMSYDQQGLHVSVMAGVPLNTFHENLIKAMNPKPFTTIRSVRVMPNIGLKVDTGVAVFSMGSNKNPEHDDKDTRFIYDLFKPNGLCYEVIESQINAYCALFGSGIGFMFPILEAMSDGAVKMGIPRAISLEIAAQVMKGAGELMLREKLHPGVLKDQVCSSGGTTITGIAEMEKYGVRNGIISAIEAATKRGEDLAISSQRKSS